MSDYPKRKGLRLKNYDYSKEGAYFVTICTKERIEYFDEHPILRRIVEDQWRKLPIRFKNIELDEFVIMPNHVHGIIFIVGADLASAQCRPSSIGKIIGAYKSICVHEWLTYIKENRLKALGTFWHRNYYERIIRNESELNKTRQYIIDNPQKWNDDENNPRNWK